MDGRPPTSLTGAFAPTSGASKSRALIRIEQDEKITAKFAAAYRLTWMTILEDDTMSTAIYVGRVENVLAVSSKDIGWPWPGLLDGGHWLAASFP